MPNLIVLDAINEITYMQEQARRRNERIANSLAKGLFNAAEFQIDQLRPLVHQINLLQTAVDLVNDTGLTLLRDRYLAALKALLDSPDTTRFLPKVRGSKK